ncbi:class I SAM-dependent methyltransferase [Belnapia sp. F-4-1]|uniref:class I SAM-dependent methyltransferase n=1 Tax=Belnapia sp. F-4-1 TaxID=1545443 RepID=UPI0005BB5600|nr:class I SAM-dependent methyltransferase [Belnapia sp. F-4-1]
MAERGGIFNILRHPQIYEGVQYLFGAERGRTWFARQHLRAQRGERVLDIGFGTAELLRHLPGVTYIGYEPNADYVTAARATYGQLGSFNQGFFGEAEAATLEPVDLAIVSAVLHHISDAEADRLFMLMRRVVKPGGRVVTLDCAFVEGQNPIARLLVGMDRGRHVRTPAGYQALAARHFAEVTGEVRHKRLPPYTLWAMTAR